MCVCVTVSLCCIPETNTFDVNQLLLLFRHQVLCDSCDPMDRQSMEFPRQEYGSGLPFPPPRDLPHPGIKPISPVSPVLQVDSLPAEPLEKPINQLYFNFKKKKKKEALVIDYCRTRFVVSGFHFYFKLHDARLYLIPLLEKVHTNWELFSIWKWKPETFV